LNISTTLKLIKAEIEDKCFFLKQAQDREEQNREAIVLAIGQASEMLELSSPLTEKDFASILSNTENVNIPQAMTEINRVAKSRKDAEVAAVARSKAIEEERIERAKKADETRIAKEVEAARAAEEYNARVVRERLERESLKVVEVEEPALPFSEVSEIELEEFEGFEAVEEEAFEPVIEREPSFILTIEVNVTVHNSSMVMRALNDAGFEASVLNTREV